jgi:hypothetical protein
MRSIFLFALIFGFIFFIGTATAAAQTDDNREPFKLKTVKIARNTPPKTVNKPRDVKRKADLSAQKKSTTAAKPPKAPAVKNSDLDVIIQTGAVVTMTRIGSPAAKRTQKAGNNGKAEFTNLTPGRYNISATLKDFVEQESEISIGARESSEIDFSLEPIKYQLNIKTNVSEGEVRYAPAKLLGRNPDNTLKLEPEGNYCIVQIRDGLATIKGLTRDYYTIDVRPSPKSPEYEPLLAAIEPDDIVDEEDEQNVEVNQITLPTKISNQQFSSAWTSDEWQLTTPGWSLRNRLSTESLSGVALPRDDRYRYYTDFEMSAYVKSLDNKTVGFALRAIDANNYYLIEIGGTRAADRLIMKGYVVKNGVPSLLNSYNIESFERIIKARESFRVIIRGKGNVFKVFIENDRGEPLPVGDVMDNFGNFIKGAIGIAERNNSNFEVNSFVVCRSGCSQ